MKHILATTDFSAVSRNAVNYAADLAFAFNAKLSLLNVCLVPVVFSEVPYAMEDMERRVEDSDRELNKLKEELAVRTSGKIDISVRATSGDFISETESYCRELNPDVVIIGTGGSNAIERVIFGSNALNALKNISWPILAIPPRANFQGIKNIGLACDLKDVDESIPFHEIILLATNFKAKLHVLHVTTADQQEMKPAELVQTHSLQNLFQDLDPIYHFFKDKNIDDGLRTFAENNDIDLLIMIPKRRPLVSQLFHKSHTKQAMLHTHIPLMALHE